MGSLAWRQRTESSQVSPPQIICRQLNHKYSGLYRKSLELRRLLDMKSKADISANNKTVICLDIAATLLGANFDSVSKTVSQKYITLFNSYSLICRVYLNIYLSFRQKRLNALNSVRRITCVSVEPSKRFWI